MKKLLLLILLATMAISCNSDSAATKSKTSNSNSGRKSNDPIFNSHEEIARNVTKAIWKEITLGDYNIGDIKLFDLGKQSSKEGSKEAYQIMTYGFQIQGDKEIFRVSLRSEIRGKMLHYLLNEEPYFSCKEVDYEPFAYSVEMKTAISKLVADGYLKRKLIEFNQ